MLVFNTGSPKNNLRPRSECGTRPSSTGLANHAVDSCQESSEYESADESTDESADSDNKAWHLQPSSFYWLATQKSYWNPLNLAWEPNDHLECQKLLKLHRYLKTNLRSRHLQADGSDLQVLVEEHPGPGKQFLCRAPTPDWIQLQRGTTLQLPDEWLEASKGSEVPSSLATPAQQESGSGFRLAILFLIPESTCSTQKPPQNSLS